MDETSKKNTNSGELASAVAKNDTLTADRVGSPKVQMAPVMGHSGGDAVAAQSVVAPVGEIAASASVSKETVSGASTGAQGSPLGTGENLERHIDEALAKIKQVRQQNTINNET